MKHILIAVLFAAAYIQAFDKPVPMEDKKPVDVERGALNTRFRQDGRLVQPGSMFAVLDRYPDSRKSAAAAKGYGYPGMALGAVGGFLIGFTAVQPLVGGDFNAPLFFSGLGTAAVSLVLGKISEGHMVKAVESYNGNQGKSGFEWRLHPAGSGAGLMLAYRFR
jgi:hypothetical protein